MLLNLIYSPGERASNVNFQAFLIEGIVQWNFDCHTAAAQEKGKLTCYNYKLLSDVAQFTDLGVDPGRPVAQYTGKEWAFETLWMN